jgi:hypothetical protein
MSLTTEQRGVVAAAVKAAGTIECLVETCRDWQASDKLDLFDAFIAKDKAVFIKLAQNGWDLYRLFDH